MDEFIYSLFQKQWVVALVAAVLLFGVCEGGFRFGLRLFQSKDESRKKHIGAVQGAVLGLLGLLLGFTFSMALGRYELRREMVVKEANVIGTTWLRAGMLPLGQRTLSRDLIRQYAALRAAFNTDAGSDESLNSHLRQCTDLQLKIWNLSESAAAEAPTPVSTSYVQTLNDMIDVSAERLAAERSRIPSGVWIMVIFVAAFGCYTGSYGAGADGARSGFTNIMMPLMITVVITLIFDITHHRQGIIHISQQPLTELVDFITDGSRTL